MATPDLNGAKLFMRGGSDESAGTVEEDSVLDHEHVDPGHTHVVRLASTKKGGLDAHAVSILQR